MLYKEFNHLQQIEDKKNLMSSLYEYEDGSRFYIEPLFYTYLINFKEQFPEEFNKVLNKMEEIVKKNKKVIFTGMDEETEEEPLTKAEGFIVLTLFDVTDMLGILVDNKSRGADYGD